MHSLHCFFHQNFFLFCELYVLFKKTLSVYFEWEYLVYIVTVCVIFVPGVLHRVLDSFGVNSETLEELHAFFFPLLGCCNALLFFNKKSIQ